MSKGNALYYIKKYGRSANAYSFGSSFIQCVFSYHILDKEKQDKLKGKNGTVNKTEQCVLNYLKQGATLTVFDLMEKTGKAERTIKRALSSLKAKGLIERIGSDKTGYWKIIG